MIREHLTNNEDKLVLETEEKQVSELGRMNLSVHRVWIKKIQ